MKVLRILIVGLAVLALALAAALGIAWWMTAPPALAANSESAARLAPGPHAVGRTELVWVDESRPTAANGDQPAKDQRTLRVALWYPDGVEGNHPLVVYSHGFMSTRNGGAYLAEHLAGHGYVVVAADYPLTHAQAPGGPSFGDVVNQPADVSFLINRVTALAGDAKPFAGEVDTERVGAFGLSLGGLTTTLVAFHPTMRDARVAAAVSIAGPADIFGPAYFDQAPAPFLMIAGTSDEIIDYELNAAPIPDRVRDGGLLAIAGGTHVGFDQIAAGAMRILGNPDGVACGLAAGAGDRAPAADENPFAGLFGGPDVGLLEPAAYRPGCTHSFEDAITAGRQHMLTTLAVYAFFESRFAPAAGARARHETFLAQTFPGELEEVTFVAGRRR